jgi:Kef-type K+ transport system membrane component KefB
VTVRLRRYLLLLGLPLLVVTVVLEVGPTLAPGQATAGRGPAPAAAVPHLPLLIAQVAAVLLASRVLGALARRVGQPQVVGEMAAGLALGPSVLGALAPGWSAALFPLPSLGFLQALSQMGLVSFMFVVGLDLDPSQLRGRGAAALFVSHGSIALPFALGTGLALALYGHLAPAGVAFAPFALFLGAALSVTAVPVLARILGELELEQTPLGTLALAAAAVGDVTAWCVLAVVVAIARNDAPGAAVTIAGAALFTAALWLGLRPLLARARLFKGPLGPEALAAATLLALACAFCTEAIGVHALFGAFLAGAVMPRGEAMAHLAHRVEDVLEVVVLPLFFAFTGLRTDLALGGAPQTLLAVVLVAVLGKLGGAAAGARLAGLSWREAGALGALMNTRGLMELVFLSVGLEVGVLSPQLFAPMVVMALVTTAMTRPLLVRLAPTSAPQQSVELHTPPL